MRWMDWVSAAVFLVSLSAAASAGSPGCGCRSAAIINQPGYAALCGEACCSPPGYALIPGCCEDHKPCCDNAWAGYCAHRAKVDAHWSRVGTPHARRHGTVCEEWTDAPANDTPLRPVPAAPSPEKSGQRLPSNTPIRK
jgi:hypothetical protein